MREPTEAPLLLSGFGALRTDDVSSLSSSHASCISEYFKQKGIKIRQCFVLFVRESMKLPVMSCHGGDTSNSMNDINSFI